MASRAVYGVLTGTCVLSSLFLYLPFLLGDVTLLFRYWDGPNYAYVAKTLYAIPNDHPFTPYGTTPAYFATHLPMYPLAIRSFAWLIGYEWAMLLTTVLFSALATVAFYHLLQEAGVVRSPLWSALLSLFLPARYLIYHSLGATEAPFLFFVFTSMLAWQKGRRPLALSLAGLSCVTRIVGVILVLSYLLLSIKERRWKTLPWFAAAGLPLLLTFVFYLWRFGDFFAYYSWNSKLIQPWPAGALASLARAGDKQGAEFYLLLYLLYGVGVGLIARHRLFFTYSACYFAFSLFLFHDDLSRYLIPIAPFALVVAYDEILSSRAFRLALVPLVPLTYVYAWGVIPHNAMAKQVYESYLAVGG